MSARDLPAPPAALFPDRQTRTRLDDQLTRALNEAGERVGRGSVMPTLDRAAFRRELAQFDFAAPRALDELLNWTIEHLEHGVVHMNHPRYFGLFNPAANFPSQCADRIAGSFNPQLASSGSSPAPVEIEAHVIRAVARRAGLPEESVRAFHHLGLGSQLHGAPVRAHARRAAFRERRRARLRRARGDVHLARMPAGLVQDRASGRHRPRCAAADRHRRSGAA